MGDILTGFLEIVFFLYLTSCGRRWSKRIVVDFEVSLESVTRVKE